MLAKRLPGRGEGRDSYNGRREVGRGSAEEGEGARASVRKRSRKDVLTHPPFVLS